MLNKHANSGHPVLFQIWKREPSELSLSLFNTMLALGLLTIHSLVCIEVCFFSSDDCWISSNGAFGDHVEPSFCCCGASWLLICICWDILASMWWIWPWWIIFPVCSVEFASIWLRVFVSVFKDIVLQLWFFCFVLDHCSQSGLDVSAVPALQSESGRIPPSAILLSSCLSLPLFLEFYIDHSIF